MKDGSSLTVRMVGEGRPLLLEIMGPTDPVGAKKPILNIDIRLYSAYSLAVTLSEKSSIITNSLIGNALYEHSNMSPKGAQTRKMAVFRQSVTTILL